MTRTTQMARKRGLPYFANVHAPGGWKATRNHPPVTGVDAMDHDAMHPGIRHLTESRCAMADCGGATVFKAVARAGCHHPNLRHTRVFGRFSMRPQS
jgi:hypothetical protein